MTHDDVGRLIERLAFASIDHLRPQTQGHPEVIFCSGKTPGQVTAIAESKVPGGTVVRVETDADGNATYEAHMTKADGTPVTVYVDSSFQFVSLS